MALSLYKPGQGYWTRMLSAIGAGTLVLAGVAWLAAKFDVWFPTNTVYWKAGMAVIVIGGFGLFLFRIFNKPRIVDFMIATETEMKKVNWPTRRDVVKSTWIIICGTAIMAIILMVVDMVFFRIFLGIGILEATTTGS